VRSAPMLGNQTDASKGLHHKFLSSSAPPVRLWT
jgi:hypothetical protein